MNLPLKFHILASGKSQISLAREIGISEPRLSKIVGGWVTPDLKVKTRIAEALGCTVEDLFPGQRTRSRKTVEAGYGAIEGGGGGRS